MIRCLLIANRGEIAVRIARTARRLGIRTVAVYSDADRGAAHVEACDQSLYLGPAAARDSYLDAARVLQAARSAGADAIHPGYGFLSENADFAAAVRAAGLIFVGPGERALRIMGSKSLAKDAVAAAGVATVPGYQGGAQSDAALRQAADRIGYPLLVKAVAGGGGKGMRVVPSADLLAEALAAARREALAAFGDDSVLLERFLERPRHIEVQVFGDQHGNVVHLYERDCSLQRRHQKVIEEAPAPFLPPALRGRLHAQAVAAARAVDYVGAGTVEFLCQDGEAWFIEMNTRLQVEHPVTEAVTGLDLVEWQLRIAAGEPLPLAQSAIACRGHAIELRVCAEDAARGLLPAIGRLACFEMAGMDAAAGGAVAAAIPWLRFDSGFRSGDVVTPYYDSLLAKLIVRGADRDAAIDLAREALRGLRVAGVATNRSFLGMLLDLPAWQAGRVDTNLIGREIDSLLAEATSRDAAIPDPVRAMLAVALSGALAHDADDSPWNRGDGFLMNLPSVSRLWVEPDATRIDIEARDRDFWQVSVAGKPPCQVKRVGQQGAELLLEVDGQVHRGRLLRDADGAQWVGAAGCHGLSNYRPAAHTAGADSGGNRVLAPMPGAVLAVHVTPGQRVERGARLLTLEAMKMEHTLTSRANALVSAVHCEAGQRVGDGAVLIELEFET